VLYFSKLSFYYLFGVSLLFLVL